MSTLRQWGLATAGALTLVGWSSQLRSISVNENSEPGCRIYLRDASVSTKNGEDIRKRIIGGILSTSFDPNMGIIGSRELYEDCIPGANKNGGLEIIMENSDPKIHKELVMRLRAEGLGEDVAVHVLPITSILPAEDAPEEKG